MKTCPLERYGILTNPSIFKINILYRTVMMAVIVPMSQAQYVLENRLGGVMFWSIDNDDFRGRCTGKQYPIIEAAKAALLAGDKSTTNNQEAPQR